LRHREPPSASPYKNMKNIYLVGFMATGKTCVGRELAAKKKMRFLDLDELIELKERRTISDIFAQDGEPCFRRIEKRTLKEVAREKNFVVACGGGIVIDPENIKVMRENGIIVCLKAKPEIILKRTAGTAHRPLLNVGEPKAQIEHLLKLRAPFYARADCTIDTSKLSPEQVVKEIIGATKSPRKRIRKVAGKKAKA
jgi:shikimate kinase